MGKLIRVRIVRQPPGPAWPAVPAAAGTWRAAGNQLTKLTRPASPGIEQFQTLTTVPIGNDGIAPPVPFSAAGGALSFVGPAGIGASWSPAQANVYTSAGQLDGSQVAIYVGPTIVPMAQYQVAASLLGGGAQVGLGGVTLTPGWFIVAVWTGGKQPNTASLYVTGTKTALVQ